MNVLLSSTIIRDLDENLDYILQVSASTSAGIGVASSPETSIKIIKRPYWKYYSCSTTGIAVVMIHSSNHSNHHSCCNT